MNGVSPFLSENETEKIKRKKNVTKWKDENGREQKKNEKKKRKTTRKKQKQTEGNGSKKTEATPFRQPLGELPISFSVLEFCEKLGGYALAHKIKKKRGREELAEFSPWSSVKAKTY